MTIDYNLEDDDLELYDVTISVPLPEDHNVEVTTSENGVYDVFESKDHKFSLAWQLVPVINSENKTGLFECTIFSVDDTDDLFPVNVEFKSRKLLAGADVSTSPKATHDLILAVSQVIDVKNIETDETLPYSKEIK